MASPSRLPRSRPSALPEDPAVAAASIPLVAPDVHTNRLPVEGRLVVTVMDRSIRDDDMKTAHAIANAAIDRLGPNDLGAVVYTGMVSRRFSQGITDDRERLHAAANETTLGDLTAAPGSPSLATAIASHGAPQKIEQLDRGVPLTSAERGGECNCGICVIDSLTALARSLTGAMGRQKSIVFVGSDIAIASTKSERLLCGLHLSSARQTDARASGRQCDIPRHRSAWARSQGGDFFPHTVAGGAARRDRRPRRDQQQQTRREDRRNLRREPLVYVLAVARDPASSKDDDRHQLKISVKRTGAIVNARNAYFASDAKAAAARAPNAVAGALNELLPGGDFSLQMNLVPEFGNDGSPEIRVLLGVDTSVAGKLDVLIRAYDRVFTPVAEPLKQRLDVPAGAVAGASAFQWASTLKPPPGDYEIRAAVATADGKHAANVIGYVDVPGRAEAGIGAFRDRRQDRRRAHCAARLRRGRRDRAVIPSRAREERDGRGRGGAVPVEGRTRAADQQGDRAARPRGASGSRRRRL